MREKVERVLSVLVGAALIFQSAGCGTILHPERKGQRDGRIDVGIAVLDAVGLLFFIIPGVIAFAVDFTNGTIYLPGGGHGLGGLDGLEKLRFDPRGDAKAQVEAILLARTGLAHGLDRRGLKAMRLESLDALAERFAAAGLVEAPLISSARDPF